MSALSEFQAELWEQPSIHKIIARAMSKPQPFKFTKEILEPQEMKSIQEWARYAVDMYEGNWDLMVKFRTLQRTGKDLSLGQLAVALNSMLRAWTKSLAETASPLHQPIDFAQVPELKPLAPAFEKPVVKHGKVEKRPIDGYFTVEFAGGWRTLRFDTHKQTGRQHVSYLCGSDNVTNYARFGYISADGELVTYKKAYKKGGEQIEYDRSKVEMAVRYICGLGQDDLLKAGNAFSEKARVLGATLCCLCGRLLTAPSSVSNNIGPICAEKWMEYYG